MKKILAIDDQQDNLITIKALLNISMPGYTVLTSLSGQEGLEIAANEQPDTIILDIIMPKMDGYEVCRKLKENELTRHIPVLMLTAVRTDAKSRIKGLDMGADAFLSKPVDPIELTAQLNVMLRIKKAEDKLRADKKNLESIVLERTDELGKINADLEEYKVKLEKKVKNKTKKLKKALKKEKELSILKSKFVSMASHEFRTPLAAISLAAGFIKKYWGKIEEKDRMLKLSKIENQIKHMTNLLDDVLTIGKTEAGQIEFNPQLIDFDKFINPILDEVQNATNNTHKIKLFNNCKLKQIFIDEKLGRKIFINLLSNAIKFSSDKKFIEFNFNSNEGFLNIEIRDFGIGINEKDLNCIFEPFRRGQNVEAVQGTGLGLAIVKESVIKLKGSINVESELDKGSTFKVSLPKNAGK